MIEDLCALTLPIDRLELSFSCAMLTLSFERYLEVTEPSFGSSGLLRYDPEACSLALQVSHRILGASTGSGHNRHLETGGGPIPILLTMLVLFRLPSFGMSLVVSLVAEYPECPPREKSILVVSRVDSS